MVEVRKDSISNYTNIFHDGKMIGSVYVGKVAVVATYPMTKMRSVLLSRDTAEECMAALAKPPWSGIDLQDIEYVTAEGN